MPAPAPPPPSDEDLESVLRELQREYLQGMAGRLAELREALTRGAGDAAREVVQRAGHRIAGTAATVGLDPLGDVGRAIERYAMAHATWTAEDVARVVAAVDLLAELARAAEHDPALPGVRDDPRVRALAEAP